MNEEKIKHLPYPLYAQFIGFETNHKKHPDSKRILTQAEHESFSIYINENKLSPEFRGQPEMTVEEMTKAAKALLKNPAFIFFQKTNTNAPERTINLLVIAMDKFFNKFKNYYEKRNIHLPFLSKDIRKIATEIFTKKTEFNSKAVYEILSMARSYSLFHLFCTQSAPKGLNFDFNQTHNEEYSVEINEADLNHRQSIARRLLKKIAPEGIKSSIVDIDKSFFSKESKWISNDKETRIKIANKMFLFIKAYLDKNPNETISIIEPGAGNGEFTCILAKLIYEDEETQGRVNLILKELTKEMTLEGRDIIDKLKDQLSSSDQDINLRINYIGGSAEAPLQNQINSIKILLETNQLKELEDKFFLTKKQAEKLLIDINGTKVIGAISTYTFGAMGEHAQSIVDQTIKDVISDGKIMFVDFAARPPDEYVNKEPMNINERKRLKKLRKIYDAYKGFGFAEGLAINFGFWEHDVMNIWKIYHNLILNNELRSSSHIDLKHFGFIPISIKEDKIKAIALPGFFQMFIKTQGIANTNTTIQA